MSEISNPYIAGAPVVESSMFFGREDIFDWIANSLSGQYADHILVVHGQRRVGKTSVLKQLRKRLPKTYIPVFFDLQGRTHTTLDRFLWWLARETVRVLKQEHGIETRPPDKEDFAKDPEYFDSVFLPDIQQIIGDASLLYTFDEFDNLEESQVKEELARPLTDYLRQLMSRGEIKFIFSIGSSGRKLENMQAAYTEFFKTALYKKISFLSKEQTQRLVTKPVEGVIEYETDAANRIYEITSGHPYFTQLTCHELFARCQRTEQRRITSLDVEDILDDVVERGTVNLKFVWDEASDIERWSLAGLAHLERADNRSLSEFLRKNRVRFSDSDLNSCLLHLQEKDVITSENRFVIHLLRLWLKKNRTIEQVREELTEVNPIANRYIEIGLEFKDAGQFDKAIDSFREALSLAPQNIQAQVNIGLTYLNQKKYNEAIAEFELALKMDDEDVSARSGLCDAYLTAGDVAIQRNRHKDAILSYQRVLSINAEHIEARQRMAELSYKRAEKELSAGKDEDALISFAEALKFTPEDSALLARVEQVRAEKKAKVLAAQLDRVDKAETAKNWEKAILALDEALKTEPGDTQILQRLERVRVSQLQERLATILAKSSQAEKSGDWDTAIGALKEYLTLQPSNLDIQERLKKLVAAKRNTWLESVVARSKKSLEAHRWDEAIAVLNEILVIEPDNADIQAQVTSIRQAERTHRLSLAIQQAKDAKKNKRWDDAVGALNDGLALEPDNQQLESMLSAVLEARRAERVHTAIRLAETAVQAGKWSVAIETLSDILTLEPENELAQNKLQEIQGKYREHQLQDFRYRARGLKQAEKFEEAIAIWQDYLAISPPDPESAEKEIVQLRHAASVTRMYAQAREAFSHADYDRAISLFKNIVVENADYKDASYWLAEAVELRRKAKKWWQNKWLWVSIVPVILFALGWGVLGSLSTERPNLPTAELPTVVTTGEVPSVEPPQATSETSIDLIATPTPELIVHPYTWVRLSSSSFLPKDQVTVLVIDPKDPGIMYLGTQHSGIYKSIDGGYSWQPSSQGFADLSIRSMVIDTDNPMVIYASTGAGGVYKSVDAGKTWFTSNNGIAHDAGTVLNKIILNAKNNQHLYFTNSTGLFESLDSGNSWQRLSFPDCMSAISNLAIHPEKSDSVWITELIDDRNNPGCERGIYKSTNAGQTWSWVEIDVSGTVFVPDSLVFDARNSEIWYLSIEKKPFDTPYQVLRSSNDGQTWAPMTDVNCSRVWSNTQKENAIYCSEGSSLWVSQNNGANWRKVQNIQNKTGIYGVFFSDSQPNAIYVGSDGIYISNDEGATWAQRASGIGSVGAELIFDVLLSPGLRIYSEEQAYGSTNGGGSWDILDGVTVNTRYVEIGSQPYRLFQHSEPRMAYALGINLQDMYSSNNGENSWTKCTDGQLANQWQGLPISALAISPDDSNHLFISAPGVGILFSTDGCQSWGQLAGLEQFFVTSIAIDPTDAAKIYAGTSDGVLISLDAGLTWGKVRDGLLGMQAIYSIVVENTGKVYALTPYGLFSLQAK